MNILALDLGTKTGWCEVNNGEEMLGTWKLATKEEVTQWGKERLTRRCDPRARRLYELVCGMFLRQKKFRPNAVVFEDVEFSTFTLQTQLWSALRAAVWIAVPPGTLIECVGVSALKKFATGHGGATKEMMMRAAPNSLRGHDDNAIDAWHLAQWAKRNLSRAVL